MLRIRYTHLPLPFVQILASNMQAGGKAFQRLRQHFEENPDLKFLLTRAVKDVDPEARLERVINSIGWLGLRDRIAAMYLQRKQLGQYPFIPDINLAKDLNLFEQRTKDYCVDGYGRAYLFAFYFKMTMFEAIETGQQNSVSEEFVTKNILDLLKLAKAKVIHIDWLLIILQHFNLSWGEEVVRQKLQAKASWKDLYSLLNSVQQKNLIENLLAYGASIGETELFVSELI